MKPHGFHPEALDSTAFPYAILYEDRPDHVRIVAVMPMHRDPDCWLHRIA